MCQIGFWFRQEGSIELFNLVASICYNCSAIFRLFWMFIKLWLTEIFCEFELLLFVMLLFLLCFFLKGPAQSIDRNSPSAWPVVHKPDFSMGVARSEDEITIEIAGCVLYQEEYLK